MDENLETNTPETTTEKSGMNPMLVGAIVIGLLVIAGGFLFLSARSSNAPTDDETLAAASAIPSGNNQVEQASETDMEIVNIEMEGGMFYFDADVITVSEGDTVKVTLTSVEGMHDFVIDEFGVASEIADEGETVSVEFVADKAGEYEFYCSVGDHRQMGMVGTLIVE